MIEVRKLEVMFNIWTSVIIGIAPLAGWLLWWWNDIWYAVPVKLRCSAGGTKLPPGYMGVPFFGEMLSFLWYFKIVRHPDDYINFKRGKYGDGVGLYRTHLFGSPSIVVYSPMANKFVLQESNFSPGWPSSELIGTSLSGLVGDAHARMRSFVVRAVNHPDALCRITLMIQPRLRAALQSWAQKGRIVVFKEAKKVTFENIGKYFANFEPGPLLDTLNELFYGVLDGIRAYPINLPGTAYRSALQCRRKAMEIFKEELEKRKKCNATNPKDDIMGGLMQMKDEEGKPLRDVEVLDNIYALVIAGFESTSLAIMWAFYYLAKYPDVLKKLREEHLPISKKLNGDFITYDDISSCKYTNKVVEEIIRLANVSTCVFRIASKDIDYKGYRIPKGWKVISLIRYLHTNPENFDDPMRFNPDRWNEPPKMGTYLVFGGGPRICAGSKLARLQVAVLIHYLVLGYRWELVNPNAEMIYLSHPRPADGVDINISKI
ncbi:Ent-kaurenoic acid oxidase 1 [Forsythia ovata]|uniref:Ent-kaurenoic acid oxidase 1 n=1 Tax=Forsythia ovata TaxID=205694 RepID=A0ABD1R1Y7_9LAMI